MICTIVSSSSFETTSGGASCTDMKSRVSRPFCSITSVSRRLNGCEAAAGPQPNGSFVSLFCTSSAAHIRPMPRTSPTVGCARSLCISCSRYRPCSALDELFALQDLDILQGRGAGHGLPAEREQMGQRLLRLLEFLVEPFAHAD